LASLVFTSDNISEYSEEDDKKTIITLAPYESICLLKAETLDMKYMESTNIFML
jgi:hypothetical protein